MTQKYELSITRKQVLFLSLIVAINTSKLWLYMSSNNNFFKNRNATGIVTAKKIGIISDCVISIILRLIHRWIYLTFTAIQF